MLRDFFEFLKNQDKDQTYWYAVGSYTRINNYGSFRYKALRCYNISLEAINYEEKENNYSANQKWKEIFGSKYTG